MSYSPQQPEFNPYQSPDGPLGGPPPSQGAPRMAIGSLVCGILSLPLVFCCTLFSVPLPIIDRSKGKKQEAQANVRVAEADLAAVEQRLLRTWGTASRRYRTAIEQVASYRERILPKANEALRLVQTGFEQGKFGFIDLLDTQRTTAEVRLTYQQKLLEMNVAQAELESLLVRVPDPTHLKNKE